MALAQLSSLWDVGLRALVTCWLWARVFPQLLATLTSPEGDLQYGSWLVLEQVSETARASTQDGRQSFYNLILELRAPFCVTQGRAHMGTAQFPLMSCFLLR